MKRNQESGIAKFFGKPIVFVPMIIVIHLILMIMLAPLFSNLIRLIPDNEPEAAEIKGCSESAECFKYGMILHQAREYDRAAELLEKGCEMDNSLSCEARGDLEYRKQVRNASPAAAEKFYDRGCQLSNRMACHNEAKVISENFPDRKGAPEQLLTLWKKACDLGIPQSCAETGKMLFEQNDFAGAAKYAHQGCYVGITEGCVYETAAARRTGAAAPDIKKRRTLLIACEKNNIPLACYEYALTLPKKSQEEVSAALPFLDKACAASKKQEFCNEARKMRYILSLPWQPVKKTPESGRQ